MKAAFKKYTLFYIVATLIFVVTYQLDMIIHALLFESMIFVSSLLLIKYYKRSKRYHAIYRLLGCIGILWAAFDMYYTFFFDVNNALIRNSVLVIILYTFINVGMAMAIGAYMLIRTEKWNKLQLALDFLLFFLIALGLVNAFVFQKMLQEMLIQQEITGFISFIIIDSAIVIMMLTMIFSSPKNLNSRSICFFFLGFLLKYSSDFLYVYEIYNRCECAISVLAPLFALATFFSFTLSLYYSKAHVDYVYQSKGSKQPENFGQFNMAWVLMFLAVIMYFSGNLHVSYIAGFLVIIVIYQIISYSLQRTVVLDGLFAEELSMQEKLEVMVEEKTNALMLANETLNIRAKTDTLTGLYNRRYFYEVVNDYISRGNRVFSIFYLDLDRFKMVNDLHGHDMGDEILIDLSRRFNACSLYDFTIARIGGDEFALLYMGDRVDDIVNLCQTVINIVEQPFQINGYQFMIGVSIGVSRYPADAMTTNELLKYADIAMYQAKSNTTHENYVLYTKNMIQRIERRNKIEVMLNNTQLDRDFDLFFQPLVNLKDNRVFACEALMRWRDANEGYISPAEFIPIAEETGKIFELSEWVITKAMRQLAQWNKAYDSNFKMGINLSPLILNQVDFFPMVQCQLDQSNVIAENIDFEITEHRSMTSSTFMEEIFVTLTSFGVSLSIDDFGTGYSSLSYIKRFDIDTLKIAKELIDNIEHSADDRLIVQAIIQLAVGMGLTTVAEGVETRGQLDVLKSLGCNYIQGYIYGRPVPWLEFEKRYLRGSQYVE